MIALRLLRILCGVALLPAGLGRAAESPAPDPTADIRRVLETQAAAWNRGDIDAFMQTYAPIADLRFASGDAVTYGWQPTLERYKQRYPNRAAMGTLVFSELEITVISTDAAMVFGHWRLKRDSDSPHGLFTLLVRRTPAGWRIFSDHTSAAAP